MKDRINVWFKADHGTRPVIIEIDNTLEALQNMVGGYIETLTVFEDAALVFNEEGRLKGLPVNCRIFGIELVGIDGEDFTDVPEGAIRVLREFKGAIV